MKNIFFILLTLFLTSLSAQDINDIKKLKGLEIYLIKDKEENINSFFNYTDEEIDQLPSNLCEFPDSICPNYINLKLVKTFNKPLLNELDINYLSLNNYTFVLNNSGIEKMNNLPIPVQGLPFVIKHKGKPVLSAWFWSIYSSEAPGRIYATVNKGSNKLKINSPYCGKDLRYKLNLVDVDSTTKLLIIRKIKIQEQVKLLIYNLREIFSERISVLNSFLILLERNLKVKHLFFISQNEYF